MEEIKGEGEEVELEDFTNVMLLGKEEAIYLLEEWNYDLQRKDKIHLEMSWTSWFSVSDHEQAYYKVMTHEVGNGEGINSTQPTVKDDAKKGK
jgi:hypothetical protein